MSIEGDLQRAEAEISRLHDVVSRQADYIATLLSRLRGGEDALEVYSDPKGVAARRRALDDALRRLL